MLTLFSFDLTLDIGFSLLHESVDLELLGEVGDLLLSLLTLELLFLGLSQLIEFLLDFKLQQVV